MFLPLPLEVEAKRSLERACAGLRRDAAKWRRIRASSLVDAQIGCIGLGMVQHIGTVDSQGHGAVNVDGTNQNSDHKDE